MARFCAVLTGPASSTASPTTFMMRPSVSGPTGTAIGWPVSATSCPRTRPSVESMAMVRTVDSPKCCATSSTRRLPPFLVSSAFKIAGRWSSNCTSTTAPMTCVIFPTALGVAIVVLFTCFPLMPAKAGIQFFLFGPGSPLSRGRADGEASSQRLRAGDNLNQFLGDHRLARTVVGQGLLADHLAGVARGIVHRGHARALLGSGIFQERAE